MAHDRKKRGRDRSGRDARRPALRESARAPRAAPWLAPAFPRWPSAALLALSIALILTLALAYHPVGDYFTETDFYGGYAAGARLWQRGLADPGRYLVVGPVYDLAVAALDRLTRDLFTAGKLVSVIAAAASLWCIERLLSRRLARVAGASGALLLVTSPAFLRYAYAATTDATACGLAWLSITALLTGGAAGPWIAGGLAALAALTRYNFIALLPAALLTLAFVERPAGRTRARVWLAYLAAFALTAGPWTAFSLAHGTVPGGGLFRNAAFYANPSPKRNVQDLPDSAAAAPGAAAAPAGGAGTATLARAAGNISGHLRFDLSLLLGWPVALLAGLGLAIAALRAPLRTALLPLALHGALLFAALLPIFYSDRYSLAYLPALLALAAVVPAVPLPAARWSRPVAALALALCLAAAAWNGRRTWDQTRYLRTQLPVETRAAGQALALAGGPGAHVIARKAHVAFYAGGVPVPFPRLGTLAELAAYARQERAGFLYFSWYEGELRPEFWYLLDTTAAVPGLTREFYTDQNPAVLYRIGERFGDTPDWFANDTLRLVHISIARALALPEEIAWRDHMVLAIDALRRGDRADAERELEIVIRVRPHQRSARDLLDRLRAQPAP